MKDLKKEKQYRDALEDECIESLKKGNTQAYSTIVKAYMKRAYYIALSFVKTEQDALDVSQEAFIKAYRHIKKFKTGSPFFPWFYQILKNLCLDWLKKNRAGNQVPLETVNFAESSDFHHSQRDEVLKMQLWKGIEDLEPEQREILMLRYFQGFSYKEMAQILDKPMGSVMSGLYYARKNLKTKMEKFLK